MIKAIALIVLMVPVKILLTLLGLLVVPIGFWTGHMPRLYRGTPGRPDTIWELAVRNPVDGLKRVIPHPETFSEAGNGLLESRQMVDARRYGAWRWRRSGALASLRCIWIYPGAHHYGELYVGFKLGSEPPDLDFALSLRPRGTVGN